MEKIRAASARLRESCEAVAAAVCRLLDEQRTAKRLQVLNAGVQGDDLIEVALVQLRGWMRECPVDRAILKGRRRFKELDEKRERRRRRRRSRTRRQRTPGSSSLPPGMSERPSAPPAGQAAPDGLHPGPVDTSSQSSRTARWGAFGMAAGGRESDGFRSGMTTLARNGPRRLRTRTRPTGTGRPWRPTGNAASTSTRRPAVNWSAMSASAGSLPASPTLPRRSGTNPCGVCMSSPLSAAGRVKAVKPSEIGAWLARLGEKYGSSTAAGAYLVLQGCLELAVADHLIKVNPAKSPVVSKPRAGDGDRVQPWTDQQVGAVIDAHPDALRLRPVLMAGCGIRINEGMGVALEDFDFGEEDPAPAQTGEEARHGTRVRAAEERPGTRRAAAGLVAAAVKMHVASTRRGHGRRPGRSSPAGPDHTTSCSGGATATTSGTGPTASRSGSRRSPGPGSSPSRAPTSADASGTSRPAKKGRISAATTTPA